MHMAGLSSLGDGVWPSLCQGGATNLLDTSAIPQETQIPTCTKFTPLFLHNYTPTTEGNVGSWFGFSNEIAAILMLSSPSNSHL